MDAAKRRRDRCGELPLCDVAALPDDPPERLRPDGTDEILSEREKINLQLQEILDRNTEPWGIKVSHVEVKQIDLPEEMKRAIAKQAEAERERRAKVINAEGEFQAAQKLIAAALVETQPMSLQLRYLQTPEPDRGGEQFDNSLPDPARSVQTVPEAGGEIVAMAGRAAPSRFRAFPR